MKTAIIKFLIEFLQKVLVTVTSSVIVKLLWKSIIWVLFILLLVICGLIAVQYLGIYDIFGVIENAFPNIFTIGKVLHIFE